MPEVSLQAAYTAAQQYLADHEIEDASVDAWYLLEYVTGISRAAYLADRDRKMSKEQQDAYVALVNQRGAHIPLQHLTGEQEFMGLPFLVNEHVLIPRQDTETLVELALEKLETMQNLRCCSSGRDTNTAEQTFLRVFDLCTGSGCIAISIAKLWKQRKQKHSVTAGIRQQNQKSGAAAGMPQQKHKSDLTAGIRQRTDTDINIEVYASDISEDALAMAGENARRLGAEVHFFQGDLFAWESLAGSDAMEKAGRECESETKEKAGSEFGPDVRSSEAVPVFDMIVSNPPYIRTDVIAELAEEVRSHEPRLALDGGADGLDFYRRILRESPAHLRDGGWLLLEIGYDQGEAVADLMRKNGFSRVQVAKDLPGQDRVVSGRWMDGREF
ncbi:MAG: peptide chain release factor N(5)-glutamine methyltransferase [Clostridiales bacterium]|nr:peptide chain release factor N(5)-glutamine methyltransferase [Clostridiales bacterium]